ncbi:uncharacterized protein LOC127131178 [Lathyrus oleraceus]|uniref:uncharacterized protein LOC127131178 n=1 Tax=Pisum sativum TaxID=3888 RepID=UPI0021D17E79|nr:uncharacterized protein LOC127131178 [Pisum sativum]
MSQHQDTSASKNTKSTPKVSVPPMGVHDDEILDVAPLSVIPGTDIDLNQPISIDAYVATCSKQGNPSSILSGSTPVTNSKEGTHYTDRVIRDLVTRILIEGHYVKGISTPLSQMHPSPEVEQPSGKADDSSSSEKDLVAEGLRFLGQTMSEKGKFVASNAANASHSKKHDDSNVVIDLEDGSSDDQEESLIHHIKPSVAKHMKTHKGSFVAEIMSARKAKKTAGIGPSKPWSKVKIKKRKVKDDSEPEEDVEEDVPNISPAKKTTIRKSLVNRRVVVERELGKEVVDVKEVMDLIKAIGLLKTIAGFSQCYEDLVKEFIVNIPEDISDKNNKEFCKVYVRGRKNEGAGELEVIHNQVCREVTTRQVKVWPVKKHLPAGMLTVKRQPALSVHYKLFEGSHVEDIVMTSSMKRSASKVGAIIELKEACKELGEGIRVARTRKQSLESLIASLEQAEGENDEHANVIHEEEAKAHTSSERSANNDNASGNSASSADEEAANSSSTE